MTPFDMAMDRENERVGREWSRYHDLHGHAPFDAPSEAAAVSLAEAQTQRLLSLDRRFGVIAVPGGRITVTNWRGR